ncbi:MAG: thioredoxin family protein [Candidatus Micrarchaeota archaeon]
MKIEVLGSGCPKCSELEKRVREAVRKTGVKAEVAHVYDLNEIIKRNVFSTPALAIDGKIVLAGKLATVEEITKIIKK